MLTRQSLNFGRKAGFRRAPRRQSGSAAAGVTGVEHVEQTELFVGKLRNKK